MPRRARQKGAEDDATIPTKIQPLPTKPPLDFNTPQHLFESFIAPVTRDEFFSTYWEKKPLLIQRSDPNMQSYYQSLFPLQDLKLASGQGIYYSRDVNLCKCKDGKKVLLPRRGKASYTEIMKDFRNAKATIQFHQPQRYNVRTRFMVVSPTGMSLASHNCAFQTHGNGFVYAKSCMKGYRCKSSPLKWMDVWNTYRTTLPV